MRILQVKRYNETIAQSKWNNCDKTKCVPSMFFFYLENNKTLRYGLNIKRVRGYVAFDNTRATFGKNRIEAEQLFNK